MADAVAVDLGREAVDDLTRQIDARFDVLYEMIETAQLGAAMNYAMQMSNCSFCPGIPDFNKLAPEVRCYHSFLRAVGYVYLD